MKKILSVFLCIVLAAMLIVPAAAADTPNEFNNYPVVIVPGYSSSQLHVTDPDGTQRSIWWVDYGSILDTVKANVKNLAQGLGRYAVGNNDYLLNILSPLLDMYVGELACNPDGTSKYDVAPDLPLTADGARWSSLEPKHRRLVGYIDELYDTDDIYMCSCDFRMGAIYNANRLDTLIKDIIKTTGCGKVNILAQSHGGQVTGTYLSLHADDAGKYVNSAVLCVPALGGAAMAYDALAEKVELDELSILKFFEYSQQLDTEYDWLLAAEPLGGVDNLIFVLLPLIKDVVGFWPSLWDFVPLENLDECLSFLDPVESAALIESTTYFHETIMAHFTENLQKAQASGVNITIIAGSGFDAVTGMNVNSDGIIPVNAATGATPAPYGQRYNDGYQCLGTVCSDPTHDHLSPSMEIDASTCYLPENTWIIDGYYHGQERMDPNTLALIRKQLLSKNPLQSVHDDPQFPQFHSTMSVTSTVHAQFDKSAEGYLSSADTALIVTNTTAHPVYVAAIEAQGVDLQFNIPYGRIIPANGSISVSFTGDIPSVNRTRAAVTLTFAQVGGSATPISARTMDFTIKNGPTPTYDTENPYVDADFPIGDVQTTPRVDNELVTRILDKLGIAELYIRVYHFVVTMVQMVQRFISMVRAF